MKYIVRVAELIYPKNPAIIMRRLDEHSRNVPMAQREKGMGEVVEWKLGDIIDDLDLANLPKENIRGYLKAGLIEVVPEEVKHDRPKRA